VHSVGEEPEGERPLEGLEVDGRIILKRILGKQGWRLRIGVVWLKADTGSALLLT
jgi:hypothetical protein